MAKTSFWPMAGLLVVVFSTLAGSSHAGEPAPGAEPVFLHFAVTLSVSDVRRSVTFFRDVVGFELKYYVLANARTTNELTDSDPEPYAAHLAVGDREFDVELGDPRQQPCRPIARYSVVVQDPAGLYSRIVARGVSAKIMGRGPSQEVFVFSVNDPDGHRFIFMGPFPND